MGSKIGIAIPSWPRYPWRVESFADTVRRLQTGLTAADCEMFCCCSAETEDVPERLVILFSGVCDCLGIKSIYWRQPPANLGGNSNRAMEMCLAEGADYILYCQDDMKLIEPLDLGASIKLLQDHPDIALIRYGWARTEFEGSRDGFPLVRMAGPEPYQDEPSLRRSTFPAEFGYYLQGGAHGSASADMMLRFRRNLTLNIAATPFRHFSHSGDFRTPSTMPERWRPTERDELLGRIER